MHTIYVITNAINGKRYVGQTAGSLAHRWMRHRTLAVQGKGFALHAALRKYGPDAFRIEGIAVLPSRDLADAVESASIVGLRSRKDQHGYNLTAGGEGLRAPSPEVRARLSELSRLGNANRSAEWRARQSVAQSGKRASAETRAKLSAVHKGKPLSAEHRLKLRNSNLGQKRSPEACANMSAARQRRLARTKGVEAA